VRVKRRVAKMAEPRGVLIVEDEPVVLRAAAMALAAHGIEFEKTTNVTGAAALLDTHVFSVVLTDLKLPGASGFEILELAKAVSPSPQVVIITGYATIENALESFRLGAFDFVPKPFDVGELVSVVDRALRFSDLPSSGTPKRTDRYYLGRHRRLLRCILSGTNVFADESSDKEICFEYNVRIIYLSACDTGGFYA
jgi:DNA-binding NtrC family response regulator